LHHADDALPGGEQSQGVLTAPAHDQDDQSKSPLHIEALVDQALEHVSIGSDFVRGATR